MFDPDSIAQKRGRKSLLDYSRTGYSASDSSRPDFAESDEAESHRYYDEAPFPSDQDGGYYDNEQSPHGENDWPDRSTGGQSGVRQRLQGMIESLTRDEQPDQAGFHKHRAPATDAPEDQVADMDASQPSQRQNSNPPHSQVPHSQVPHSMAPHSETPASQERDSQNAGSHRAGDQKNRNDRPPRDGSLIDPVVLIVTAWRYRYFVIFASILGAVLGVMIALATPHKYESVSQFVLDPRELRLTDTDFLPQSYSAESILALVDSQVQIVDSSPVLQAVVTNLDLADDPEFNGTAAGGVFGAVEMLRSLIGGKSKTASDYNNLAVQSLSRQVQVYRGEKTFIVYVAVKTEDAEKSARIANEIVDVYIVKQQESQSALFERTAVSFGTQLDALRKDVEAAERRVEEYKAKFDLVDAGGNLISDEQIITLNQQLAQLRAQKVEIQVKADSARQVDINALLTGTSPEILGSTTIGELRAEYASAKRISDSLATSLGPRHPQRIAAEQALDTARAEINNELRRIVESTQTELRRVIRSEQQVATDLAVLKSKHATTSGDLVQLRELEREANATSAIYVSFLKRARETREQQSLNTSNIRVISAATPALKSSGPSRKFIAIGGLLAGLFGGLAIAILAGIYKSLASGFKRASRDRFDEPYRNTGAPPPQEEELVLDPADYADEEPADDRWQRRDLPNTSARPWQDEAPQPSHMADFAPENEEEQIRADIREMRETVERLQQARRSSREPGRFVSS